MAQFIKKCLTEKFILAFAGLVISIYIIQINFKFSNWEFIILIILFAGMDEIYRVMKKEVVKAWKNRNSIERI